ncbi:MAG: hypothetical protein KDJ29_00270 [Hyphomicrobiales bacterium]|nr:hypothetical protein [Hyphomicrobiales bacterium]
MTLETATRAIQTGIAGPGKESVHDSAAPGVTSLRLAIWAVLFQFAWNAKRLPDIIREGWMPDPDDFLRLHEIRNWLGGQGWFDVSVSRMNPPAGSDMHWSRLVDAPIALLMKFLDLFTSSVMAERIAIIVWPTLLLVCLVLILAAICERTSPRSNKLVTLLFTVMCVPAMAEFAPGRIDHHSVQIILFALALLGLVNRDRVWGSYLIGAAIAGSIAIGIDTFPLLVVLLAFLGFDWTLGRDDNGAGLVRTGAAMSGAVVLLLLVSVPPSQWWVAKPDAISIFFVALLLTVSAGFAVLYALSPHLPEAAGWKRIGVRMTTGALVAAGAAGIMGLLYGDILSGDFAGVSPELQSRWLNDIIEIKSLPQILRIMPEHWLSTAGYSAVLLVGGFAALRASPRPQPQLATIYIMLALAIAATFFQFRLLRTGIIASVPVSVAIFAALMEFVKSRSAHPKMTPLTTPLAIRLAALPAAVLVLLQPVWLALGLAVAGSGSAAASNAQTVSSAMPGAAASKAVDGVGAEMLPDWRKGPVYPICNRQSHYRALAKLPRGLVLNDLNSGPSILIFTKHDVLASNYHRNGKAILQALDFFETDAKTARGIARQTHAAYVGFCDSGKPAPRSRIQDRKLASRILRNDLPPWLQRVSPAGDRFIVLKILKDQ